MLHVDVAVFLFYSTVTNISSLFLIWLTFAVSVIKALRAEQYGG